MKLGTKAPPDGIVRDSKVLGYYKYNAKTMICDNETLNDGSRGVMC